MGFLFIWLWGVGGGEGGLCQVKPFLTASGRGHPESQKMGPWKVPLLQPTSERTGHCPADKLALQ